MLKIGGMMQSRSQKLTKGLIRWGIRQVIFLVILMFALMVPYSRFSWLEGWIFLGIVAIVQVSNAILLIPKHSDLLVERSGIGENTNKQDIILAFIMAYSTILIGVVCALDHRFLGSHHFPVWLWGLSIVLSLCASGFTQWAMVKNPFFSGVVRIQFDRGHHVVIEGPYQLVRHPGYLGAIFFMLMIPILLKSWLGFVAAIIFIILAGVRTYLEDFYLQAKLPGYADYAKRVRYRLLPGIW